MPINLEVINHPINRCGFFSKDTTVRDSLQVIANELKQPQMFHIIFELEQKRWGSIELSNLLFELNIHTNLIEKKLCELDFYDAPLIIENEKTDLSKAISLCRSSPGNIVIVTEENKVTGIINKREAYRSFESTFGILKNIFNNLSFDINPANKPKRIDRYTDISCPQSVNQNTPRFHLVVRLTVTPCSESNHSEKLELNPNQNVIVTIFAKHFSVLTPSSQSITLVAGQDSSPVVFYLKPEELGTFPITLTFFQELHPLGVVNIPVDVVETLYGSVPTSVKPQPIEFDGSFPPPEKVIEIHFDRHEKTLTFSLQEQGNSHPIRFDPIQLYAPPDIYVKKLFETLTASERNHQEDEDQGHQLKICGQSLWETVVPKDFKTYYEQNRASWRDQSVLIYSDEPYFPWELIQPWGDGWQEKDPWCLSLKLSRWLRRNEQNTGCPVPQGTLRINSLAHIAPNNVDDLVGPERDYLKYLMDKWELLDASPAQCNWRGVMDLFEKDHPQWVHLTAHGLFREHAPNLESEIRLDGPDPFHPYHVTGPNILNYFKKERPSFIFNSCHVGRVGFNLNGVGGWAGQLIHNHASMFLAPLWAVRASSAIELVQNFYNQLFDGLTVAEALRKARIEARKTGNSSWLAYSLYAHPNAALFLK